MRLETKIGLKFILYFILTVIIGVITFQFYLAYQFSNGMSNLVETLSEHSAEKRKRKADRKLYGKHIEEIDLAQYEKYKQLDTTQIVASNIQKNDGQILIHSNKKVIKLQDHFDNECMACTVAHEVEGEIPSLDKLLVSTCYFRRCICQVIDLNYGRIDTLNSTPVLSPNGQLILTANKISKDTLTKGLNLYSAFNQEI